MIEDRVHSAVNTMAFEPIDVISSSLMELILERRMIEDHRYLLCFPTDVRNLQVLEPCDKSFTIHRYFDMLMLTKPESVIPTEFILCSTFSIDCSGLLVFLIARGIFLGRQEKSFVMKNWESCMSAFHGRSTQESECGWWIMPGWAQDAINVTMKVS